MITIKETLSLVLKAKTLADIKSLFQDAFGLSEAQLMGAYHIIGLPDAEAPVELTEAAKMANPKFQEGGGYARNCQRCAPVFELLRRGIICQACPNPNNDRSGTEKRLRMNGSECFINAEIHGLDFDSNTPIHRQQLLRYLNLQPNGYRACVYWVTPDGRHAHIIVCEKIMGELKFADPQTGEVGTHVLGHASRENGYYWYRTDNLELNPDFEWEEVVTYDRE